MLTTKVTVMEKLVTIEIDLNEIELEEGIKLTQRAFYGKYSSFCDKLKNGHSFLVPKAVSKKLRVTLGKYIRDRHLRIVERSADNTHQRFFIVNEE